MSENRPKFAPVLTDEQRAYLREKRKLSDLQIDSLTGRGLRFETIKLARLEGRMGAGEIARALSLPSARDVSNAPPAIAIPWFDPQTDNPASLPRLTKSGRVTSERVRVVRLRYDEPFSRDTRKPEKEPPRYDQPGKIPFIVYVPRWQAARAALADASKPLVITEGEFKTLALAQEGYAVIGIGGCQSAHDKPFLLRFDSYRLHRWITGGAFYGERRNPLCPLAGRRVLLALDGDSRDNPDVDKALGQIAGMLALEDVEDVRNACPPDVPGLKKSGIDDFLAHRGPAELHTFLSGNLPRVEPIVDPRAETLSEREEILLLHNLHDDVAATLTALAEDPNIFCYGGTLVDVVPGGGMERLTRPALMAERIERRCLFMDADGSVSTPARLADNLASRTVGFGAVRELTMLSRDPVLRPDGSVLTNGYDADLRVYVDPRENAQELGDLDDMRGAREALLEAVGDFRFIGANADQESEASKAGWFAALITLVSRHLIDGETPMHLIDAADSEAGKSLLVRLLHRIALDAPPPDGTAPNNEELSKRLFAAALAGERTLVIDNVDNDGALGSPALDQFLTSTTVGGRVLGKSEMRTVPWRAVIFASGNNVRLRGDLNRRVVLTRIQKHPGPFTHTNLTGWAKQNRMRLYGAALTIVRAWLRAGRPAHTWQRWGGFDAWDEFVRGVLHHADLGDPRQMRTIVDARHDEHAPIAAVLEALRPHGSLMAKEILARMERDAEMKHAIEGLFTDRELVRGLTARALTRRLTRYEGRTVGDQRLTVYTLDHTSRFRVDSGGLQGFRASPSNPPNACARSGAYMSDDASDGTPAEPSTKPRSPEALDVSGSDNPTTNQTPEHSGGSDLDAHTCEQPSDMSAHQGRVSRDAAELVRLSGCPEPQPATASFDDLFGHLPETLPDDAA